VTVDAGACWVFGRDRTVKSAAYEVFGRECVQRKAGSISATACRPTHLPPSVRTQAKTRSSTSPNHPAQHSPPPSSRTPCALSPTPIPSETSDNRSCVTYPQPKGRGVVPGCPVNCDNLGDLRTLTFCEMCVHHQVPGNLALAILGHFCGYSRNDMLIIVAGLGSSPEDREVTKAGVRAAKKAKLAYYFVGSDDAKAEMLRDLRRHICFELDKRADKNRIFPRDRRPGNPCALCTEKEYVAQATAAKPRCGLACPLSCCVRLRPRTRLAP
jgi:hypothetical protein